MEVVCSSCVTYLIGRPQGGSSRADGHGRGEGVGFSFTVGWEVGQPVLHACGGRA